MKIKSNPKQAELKNEVLSAVVGENSFTAQGLNVRTDVKAGQCSKSDYNDGCPMGEKAGWGGGCIPCG